MSRKAARCWHDKYAAQSLVRYTQPVLEVLPCLCYFVFSSCPPAFSFSFHCPVRPRCRELSSSLPAEQGQISTADGLDLSNGGDYATVGARRTSTRARSRQAPCTDWCSTAADGQRGCTCAVLRANSSRRRSELCSTGTSAGSLLACSQPLRALRVQMGASISP